MGTIILNNEETHMHVSCVRTIVYAMGTIHVQVYPEQSLRTSIIATRGLGTGLALRLLTNYLNGARNSSCIFP